MKEENRQHASKSTISAARIASVRNKLLSWYAQNGRRFRWRLPSRSLYELVVAEVLLQRTRAEVVEGFYLNFIRKYPSWEALSKSTKSDLEAYLRPLGLWQRRAASLRAFALEMAKRHGRFPLRREEIESLPGVGQYIANAILLFSRNEPEPLLDVNMARVLERYFGPRQLADIRYDPYLQDLARRLLKGENAREVNWAILDFGAIVCQSRNPRCDICPLRQGCCFFRNFVSKPVATG